MSPNIKTRRQQASGTPESVQDTQQGAAPQQAAEPGLSQPTGLRGRAKASFSKKSPELMSSLEHFQEAQIHRSEADRIGYRNGKRLWDLDEHGKPVTPKDAEVQSRWQHHTRLSTAHMQMGVAKNPSHPQYEEARNNGAFETGAKTLGFTWRDPLTLATGSSPKEMVKLLLQDTRFEGTPLKDDARFFFKLAQSATPDATLPETDPAYYVALEKALASDLVKGTDLEEKFRLTLDAWTAGIPADQRTKMVQGKGVMFPYAKRLEDLFEKAEPHAQSQNHGPDGIFSSYMSVRGKDGAHVPALSVTLSASAAEAVASWMLHESPGSIYFSATCWDEDRTLILAKYEHLIGERWLAVVATDSVPGLAGVSEQE